MGGYGKLACYILGEKRKNLLLIRECDKEEIDEVVRSLDSRIGNPTLTEFVELKFGLGGKEIHSLDEIKAMFGISKIRIEQCEKQSIRELRHSSRRFVFSRLFRFHMESLIGEQGKAIKELSSKLEQCQADFMDYKRKVVFGDQWELASIFRLSPILVVMGVPKAMSAGGISTLGDLVKTAESELLMMEGIDHNDVRRVKSFLEEYGLTLSRDLDGRVG